MTIEQFNEKYKNIKTDYPDIFKITRSTYIQLNDSNNNNIAEIINEYKASNMDLEKLINFQKEILNDLKQIKGE